MTTEIIRLAAHDPIPDDEDTGGQPFVVVMRRMAEDDPDGTATVITLSGNPPTEEYPVHPDGRMLTLDEAIEAGRQLAESRHIKRMFVIDRTEGAREHDVLAHGGDHTVGMDALADDDLEEGERGPDMRDLRS